MSYYRLRRRSLLTSILIISLLLLSARLFFPGIFPQAKKPMRKYVHCSDLVGANSTLVVLKTGSTELQDKLPVHFHTTLLCYPQYLIFSDFEETYEGHHILDALEFVNETIKETNSDFELWRRLQQFGRSALSDEELSGPEAKVSPMTGKGSNPGWKLDKWKFLPMVNRTLELYPDMKWYIFVETDTYLFWSTALAWINSLDHTKPYYLGSQMQIGEVVFGHGGSGIIVSHTALKMVVEFFKANQAEWEDFTGGHWAGDCVLGKAFKDAGAPLGWAWPTIQGVKPGAIGYEKFDYGKRMWCFPTISYHHLNPRELEDIWRFEQEWLLNEDKIVRHKDVFKDYIVEHIRETKGTKSGWDNLSGKFEDEAASNAGSFDQCRAMCRAEPGCVQFAFSQGRCTTSNSPHWGESNSVAESGWFLDRVEKFRKGMRSCEGEMWPV